MTATAFENEFLRSFSLLTKEQQAKVITYVQSLLKESKRNNQDRLLKFAGSFSSKDAQEVKSAIEAGCENIDKAW